MKVFLCLCLFSNFVDTTGNRNTAQGGLSTILRKEQEFLGPNVVLKFIRASG